MEDVPGDALTLKPCVLLVFVLGALLVIVLPFDLLERTVIDVLTHVRWIHCRGDTETPTERPSSHCGGEARGIHV
jgi:hypothetical protein